ncbi:MAG: YdeI/OmpD-associated family protein [Crocinitomicaceae bacterium]|nr:YdeI/OmpD-associated family protein [Crocinitomicaceae bacterium]
MNPQVDNYIESVSQWQGEIQELRRILLDCKMEEGFKWSQPCYSDQKKNIVSINGFKNYCSLMFFKGSLLTDPDQLLIQAGENSNSMRQMRFTSVKEILKVEAQIKSFVFEAIENERSGMKVESKKPSEMEVVEEFQVQLDQNEKLKKAFENLTPGRQRAYLMHFAQAKQSKTRETRVEKFIPRILIGKGMDDCVCGLSKRMPSCDGSHKSLK